MRQIKFRAWDENLGLMINPYCELKDGAFWGEDCTNTGFSPSHEHIMQFTGLTDEDKKEAYEGDIVINMDGDKRIIMYVFNSFEMRLPNGERQKDGVTWHFQFNVIGNIHQDSHLLK